VLVRPTAGDGDETVVAGEEVAAGLGVEARGGTEGGHGWAPEAGVVA
jgi:hypothetical protein